MIGQKMTARGKNRHQLARTRRMRSSRHQGRLDRIRRGAGQPVASRFSLMKSTKARSFGARCRLDGHRIRSTPA